MLRIFVASTFHKMTDTTKYLLFISKRSNSYLIKAMSSTFQHGVSPNDVLSVLSALRQLDRFRICQVESGEVPPVQHVTASNVTVPNVDNRSSASVLEPTKYRYSTSLLFGGEYFRQMAVVEDIAPGLKISESPNQVAAILLSFDSHISSFLSGQLHPGTGYGAAITPSLNLDKRGTGREEAVVEHRRNEWTYGYRIAIVSGISYHLSHLPAMLSFITPLSCIFRIPLSFNSFSALEDCLSLVHSTQQLARLPTRDGCSVPTPIGFRIPI